MDFHSLARRDLQLLCKKNKIQANLTNTAMADALKALKSIEWDEEIRQKLMLQSESMEQHGSPLPRSRRVAAISSDMSGFSITDKEDEIKKEASNGENQTPATAVRRSLRIQSAMSTRTRARTNADAVGTDASAAGTRTRRSKKEAAAEAVVVATPAPHRGRKKTLETPAPVPVTISSAQSTRQSTRRLAERTTCTRSTRFMANIMAFDADDFKEAHTGDLIEKTEDVAAMKQEQLISDEKLNSVDHDVDLIEISEEKSNTSTDESEGSIEKEFNNEMSDEKEIYTEKAEEAMEEKSNSDVSQDKVEKVVEVELDTIVTLISEGQVDPEKESEVNQTILADSPMMGLASNSDLQDTPPCGITFDVQDDPEKESELDQNTLTYSPIMGLVSDTQDVVVEKMLNSVVRHFARASIKDSAKKIDATDKMISDDVPELEQNENAVEEKVDLSNMSLRKLKALYKDRLTELNSKKAVADEGTRRLPLEKLDENLLV